LWKPNSPVFQNAASIINDRNHRLFDRQMLEEIRQRRADQQIQPSPEEDGMFQGAVTRDFN
jgi:hypothetical protein